MPRVVSLGLQELSLPFLSPIQNDHLSYYFSLILSSPPAHLSLSSTPDLCAQLFLPSVIVQGHTVVCNCPSSGLTRQVIYRADQC